MAPLTFVLTVAAAAQALCSTLPHPRTASSTIVSVSTSTTSLSAPSPTAPPSAPFCPGVISTHNPFPDPLVPALDNIDPYCCVDNLSAPAPPMTRWFYDHEAASIPSTVIYPTTCMQSIPLAATDYHARATAAAMARPAMAEGQRAQAVLAGVERQVSRQVIVTPQMESKAGPRLRAGVGVATTLSAVVLSTPVALALVTMWFTTIIDG